ncbi:MAG: SRPBCC family protein [Jatrophihabitantaceae bacterium]
MAIGSSRYVFRSLWRLDSPVDRVYNALVDVANYPDWWPQVRATRQLDDCSGELSCRSLLPYKLVFVATREIEDRANGILRARVSGDLNGRTQWTITSVKGGTTAVFDEDVVVGTRALRLAGRLARPALRVNHRMMMQAGEQGLRRLLAR